MDPLRPLELKLKLIQPFSDEHFNELALSIRGRVLRPGDVEYPERSRTFNGKLKPRARALVSPLDADDVSAAIKFCAKYGFSPSVRAGGYGIAGWAVAGDIIIDMSMMTDIDLEPPLSVAEGSGDTDWTRLRDMPPLGSKGKGRAPASPPPTVSSDVPHRSNKRRRDERSPSEEPEQATSPTAGDSFYGGSTAVASFLRGPPLPPEPGETPRQPPTNRQRLHSPEPEELSAEGLEGSSATATGVQHSHAAPLSVLPLSESTRQLSGESTSSGGSSRPSAFGFETHASQSSDTTAAASPSDDNDRGSTADTREPFAYMSSGNASTPRLPMFGLSAGQGSTPTVSTAPPGVTFVQNWPMPPSAGGAPAGVAAWNPAIGPGFGIPPSLTSLPMPLSMTPGQPFPPISGALGLPSLFGVASDARTGNLGTVQYSKPVHPHAYVTFGAGMRQREIDQYTADHPLVGTNTVTGDREEASVPYHIPMSAHPVGSSIMLLAGFGFISRLYGLSIDNVVEVEMVLADGRIVVVNAEEDPELWWAIRGAGPAFGIATRYKVRAFPVPVVFAGNLIYRFHRATAPSLIKHFRDCIKNAPRELYANVLLTAGPADKDSLVVIQMCYVGPREKGMEYLQAISSWDGERCLLNEVNEKSFLKQQDSVAQVLRGKAGRQWFLRSALITTLPDEVINRTVLEFADTPIGCTWLFELAGGAIGDFEDNCLPKEQREATWTVAAFHQWDMGIDDPRCITTAEQWMDGTIKQVAVGGPYPTFLGRHESPSRTMACYGKNWDRLAALKRKYDPNCLFKNNFWPLDKNGQPVEFLANEPPSP
ncbi:hypothetical protein C8Q78DRAFT_1080249 [Trametes maxima]|nr:hypothetical protein C8Q78DRAFT_1080249 [Trametes maxima]